MWISIPSDAIEAYLSIFAPKATLDWRLVMNKETLQAKWLILPPSSAVKAYLSVFASTATLD